MSAKSVEGDEHDIESFKPREDAPKSGEPTEQPFDLGSPLAHCAVVFPPRDAILLERKEQGETQVRELVPSEREVESRSSPRKDAEAWTDYRCAQAH